MRVGITGARSDLASALIDLCSTRGDLAFPAPGSAELNVLGPVELWEEWLTSTELDVLVHLAGKKPPATAAELMAVNVDGTKTVLEALARVDNDAKLIVASSSAVYGDVPAGQHVPESARLQPNQDYGRSKVAQEELVRNWTRGSGRMAVAVRIFNMLGGRNDKESVTPAFVRRFKKVRNGEEFVVKNGACVRDFIDVIDVAAAILAVAEAAQWRIPAVNICTAQGTSVAELAALIGTVMGKTNVEVRSVDDGHPSKIVWSVGDNTELQRFGWQPQMSLRQSIERVVAALGA